MSRKFFGTDGVRGRANSYPMTADFCLKLGAAAGSYFRRANKKSNRVVIVDDSYSTTGRRAITGHKIGRMMMISIPAKTT